MDAKHHFFPVNEIVCRHMRVGQRDRTYNNY